MGLSLDPQHFYGCIGARAGRLLGVDVGTANIGLALSDRTCLLASALETLRRTSWKSDLPRFEAILKTHSVVGMVVGLPLNMDGTEGPRCEMVRKWASKFLSFIDLPLYFWDERLSTVAAHDLIRSAPGVRKDPRDWIDQLAARHILMTFLEEHPRLL